MADFRWEFYGEGVLAEIAKAPQDVKEDFYQLMDRVTRSPRRSKGVIRLQGTAGGFMAPFDDGWLVYQVLADYPRIHLLMVVWD